ncbi:hypothetical protein Gasu2_32600 [Galdieria sulphuraria]|uniref:Uncharacterized protein n=1 Tax=Galdieria sulphuraria TaxID=130081 RepID=M2Y435_GALSU|nr:uncharacterized protein Gasu_20510 [Galdieria sulphuraria]EME30589.1 hypothetical protein Gasu_20510 [Galdieria sulphuraria]GJD08985.1 hypothetical protein Gasu2_32600 [Galdieria sulphuraria]|eukprot:XP_005707109.1 hypothetical protein Gasu_20510 [Galdieria sulphuraria]
MPAFVRFGCFTKTFIKTFDSGRKCIPFQEALQRPCISQTCRRSLRNLFIVAQRYRVPYCTPIYCKSPTDEIKEKRAKLLVAILRSVSSILFRPFVSVVVSLLALSFGYPVVALATKGEGFERKSITTTWSKDYESSASRSVETQTIMVKSAKVSEQNQIKQRTSGSSKEASSAPKKMQLAKSEKLITWGLTLLVFAGVCVVLYKISLKEEEEEAKAIEREYERLEQLKREFIETDEDSPVRDEDLLSSLRKRLENQTQEDSQGTSEVDSEAKDPNMNIESVQEESHSSASVESEEVASSERTSSTEGVSIEHLDMLRRMYEGTSKKNIEDGNGNLDVNNEDGRNAANDTKYDEKDSKDRKNHRA